MEKTLGESRVRTDFNISRDTVVDKIKTGSARLIDCVDQEIILAGSEGKQLSEFMRLKALAMTAYEEAAMWAVKAATM